MTKTNDRIEEYVLAAGTAVAPYGTRIKRNVDTGEILEVEQLGGSYPGDSPFLGIRETVGDVIAADDPATALGVESHFVRDASGVHEETHQAIKPAASAKSAPHAKDVDPDPPRRAAK